MPNTLILRKVLRLLVVLAACFAMTGCYTLKKVSITKIPEKREILVIHAGENYWTTRNYTIADGIFTAHLSTDTLKIPKGKTAHVYAAPVTAVSVEGAVLTLPVLNIAKADYQDVNIGATIGFVLLCVPLLFTLMMIG